MALAHLFIHLAACGKPTRAIGIMVQYVICKAINHALRHLRASGAIEINGRLAVDASTKGWKLRADGIELMCDAGHRQNVIVAFQAVE